MANNLSSLVKAAGIPVATWAVATVAILAWEALPAAHSQLTSEDPVLQTLLVTAYGGLIAGTSGGWLLLRRQVHTKTALILLVPYLALIALGVVITFMAAMAITGDSF
jgi:hypothetical protein